MNRKLLWIFLFSALMVFMQVNALAKAPDVEFNIDFFNDISSDEISYANDVRQPLSPDISTVIYNEIEVGYDDVFNDSYVYPSIYYGCHQNGSIRLSDGDGDGDYDVIEISTFEIFVVETISEFELTLKNGIGVEVFDYNDICGINALKGVLPSVLKKGDVLKVCRNPFAPEEQIHMEFVDSAFQTQITQFEPSQYSWHTTGEVGNHYYFYPDINDTQIFDMAYGAYGLEHMKIGYAGTVYMVYTFDCWKVAAFFFEDNLNLRYGVVVDYKMQEGFNGRVTIMSNRGVREYMLDDVVRVEYPDSELTDFVGNDISQVEDKLIGKLIKFESALSGICAVEFPKTTYKERQLVQLNSPGWSYIYDTQRKTFDRMDVSYAVDENTKVYYVYNTSSGNSYGIDVEWSALNDIASLTSGTYTGALFYDLNNDTNKIKVVTIFDNNPYSGVKFFNSANKDRTDTGFYYTCDNPITVKLNPQYQGKQLLLAAYKNNALINFLKTPASQSQAQISLSQNGKVADCIKAFVWKDLNRMQPILVQTLYRNAPSTPDYSQNLAVLESVSQILNSEGEPILRINYYQNGELKTVNSSAAMQCTGFRVDGEEGFDAGKSLQNYIGSCVTLNIENDKMGDGEIVQITLLATINHTDIPTITIGNNINKTTEISGNFTLFVGVVTDANSRTITLGGYNDNNEFIENLHTVNTPVSATVYSCDNRGGITIEQNTTDIGYEMLGKYVVMREYEGVVTDVLIIH